MDLRKSVTFVTFYDNQSVKCYFGCYFNVIIVTLYILYLNVHNFYIHVIQKDVYLFYESNY